MRREFTSDLSDCFFRSREQRGHVIDFCEFAKANPAFDFYWPNYDKAPWHVQCVLRLDGQDKEVNFWPHKDKGQIIYEKAIEGLNNFVAELNRRAGDGDEDDDFYVFE
jgi:hypothetical protein